MKSVFPALHFGKYGSNCLDLSKCFPLFHLPFFSVFYFVLGLEGGGGKQRNPSSGNVVYVVFALVLVSLVQAYTIHVS